MMGKRSWFVAVAASVLALVICARATAQGEQPKSQQAKTKAAAQKAPPKLPAGVKVERDIEYVAGGGKSRSLDMYTPEEPGGKLPLIVWIHGGGWSGGDKQQCPAVRMVARGYVAASVNYRLSQEAIFPAQIEDCKAAIRWLRANADKYGIDPDRIGVWGGSAGGHLVALLGTSGGIADLEGSEGPQNVSSRVQAVCDWFGPADFTRITAPPSGKSLDAPDSPVSRLLGGPVLENKDKARRASPITYVTRDDPPILIMHGDKDYVVPLDQSEMLYEVLKKAGVDATMHVVKGAGHGFRSPEVDAMVDSFFDRVLKGKK
ncbi:alpha/beta hydrolase [Candidatus Sumerlaeota bacterium]|nr:alpha/beta hydrolase [Candidatus Sumerlaeota bacterium]